MVLWLVLWSLQQCHHIRTGQSPSLNISVYFIFVLLEPCAFIFVTQKLFIFMSSSSVSGTAAIPPCDHLIMWSLFLVNWPFVCLQLLYLLSTHTNKCTHTCTHSAQLVQRPQDVLHLGLIIECGFTLTLYTKKDTTWCCLLSFFLTVFFINAHLLSVQRLWAQESCLRHCCYARGYLVLWSGTLPGTRNRTVSSLKKWRWWMQIEKSKTGEREILDLLIWRKPLIKAVRNEFWFSCYSQWKKTALLWLPVH